MFREESAARWNRTSTSAGKSSSSIIIGLDELHVVVEILGRPEIGVVDGDHVVVGREPVREIRADKARATRHENALIVHECVYSRLGNYRFGFIHLKIVNLLTTENGLRAHWCAGATSDGATDRCRIICIQYYFDF